jgi:hypothetical protein
MDTNRRFAVLGLAFFACLAIPVFQTPASAQDVTLENVSFDQVLTELFGTAETSGLLDREEKFAFHAEGVRLTNAEAASFFTPASSEVEDFEDLVVATEQRPGSEVRIRGHLEDTPFELELVRNEVRLDGIRFTQPELDGLVEKLQRVSSLRESRMNVRVEGRPVALRVRNEPRLVEQVEVEPLLRDDARAEPPASVTNTASEGLRRVNVDRPVRLQPERLGQPSAVRTERPAATETPAQPERSSPPPLLQRIEKPQIPERAEKPEPQRNERPDRGRGRRDDDDDD